MQKLQLLIPSPSSCHVKCLDCCISKTGLYLIELQWTAAARRLVILLPGTAAFQAVMPVFAGDVHPENLTIIDAPSL